MRTYLTKDKRQYRKQNVNTNDSTDTSALNNEHLWFPLLQQAINDEMQALLGKIAMQTIVDGEEMNMVLGSGIP